MRPRYSLVELQIIHKWLCKYPSNYQEGFRKAIVEIQETTGIERTLCSIRSSFYTSNLFKEYFNTNPIQGLHTINTLVEINRKNCMNKQGVTHPDLHQVNIQPLGIVNRTQNQVSIRMQTASFTIGNIIITGENIEINTL